MLERRPQLPTARAKHNKNKSFLGLKTVKSQQCRVRSRTKNGKGKGKGKEEAFQSEGGPAHDPQEGTESWSGTFRPRVPFLGPRPGIQQWQTLNKADNLIFVPQSFSSPSHEYGRRHFAIVQLSVTPSEIPSRKTLKRTEQYQTKVLYLSLGASTSPPPASSFASGVGGGVTYYLEGRETRLK